MPLTNAIDLFRPSVVKGMWSEVLTPYNVWQDFFKLGPGGEKCEMSETRRVAIDIVDDDRTVASGRAPGADAAVIPPMVLGNRPITVPRSFEKMGLDFELLNNIRAIGEGASNLDKRGMQYVKQMVAHMARRGRRWREFMIWGMLRGTAKFDRNGVDWIPIDPAAASADFTIDWQIPADHKDQAGGIIGESWDTSTTEIITDLAQLTAQSEEDSGMPLTHAWVNHSRMVKILNNDQVKAMGGTANTAFETWNFQESKQDGIESSGIPQVKAGTEIVLRGFPQITWHVTNRVTKLDNGAGTGTQTTVKYLGDDEVILHPDLSYEWYKGFEVKESTNQVTGTAPVDVYGMSTWIKFPVDRDVPQYWLFALDNFMPACNPNAIFFLDVTP